jgi:hypothetical protein
MKKDKYLFKSSKISIKVHEKGAFMKQEQRYRATMTFKRIDRFVRREFGYMEGVKESWQQQGLTAEIEKEFNYDERIDHSSMGNLGWCEPPFYPPYVEEVLEDLGDYEIKRDLAGRQVKYFKGRTNGFMPTYLQHAVKSRSDWEYDVKPRLNPETPERISEYDQQIEQVVQDAKESGKWVTQEIIGQYMYLRALFGPEDVMYVFYDDPELIHDILKTWMELNDAMIQRLQAKIEIDELFYAEDICYNHGLLISPDMWREFLKPYYLELYKRAQARQEKRIYTQIDTDGFVEQAIPLYLEIGMDIMSPFEACSGQDVVEVARQYPKLVITGGINKQVLSKGKEAINAHLEHIIPFMVKRGGFVPTCDHSVPLEVSLEDYIYYRKRIIEIEDRERTKLKL